MPKVRQSTFEAPIIERYRRRGASVEEALVEMCLAGVSGWSVEDIAEALWGTRVPPGNSSEGYQLSHSPLLSGAPGFPPATEPPPETTPTSAWTASPSSAGGAVRGEERIGARRPQAWPQTAFERPSGSAEGAREGKASWSWFLRRLKEKGLSGAKPFISDAALGLIESLADFFPDATWQRCTALVGLLHPAALLRPASAERNPPT